MSTIYNTIESANLTENVDRIKYTIVKFDKWYHKLDSRKQKDLERLYNSARLHLGNAKSDITALTSEYLVCIARDLAESKEENV